VQQSAALLSLIRRAHACGASDLILVGGSPPTIYRHGRMQPLHAAADGEDDSAGRVRCADQESSRGLGADRAPDGSISASELGDMILAALDEPQRERLACNRDLDFSVGLPGVGRLRLNVHHQRRSLAAAIRFVADTIPDLADLHLPPGVARFAEYPRGMVLVTGGTGEGKSTTLAAMIERINHLKALHVITLEDPIEYAFRNDRCIIEQREIGQDAPSFASALRHVVRQKPDVILIGEMRDLETISTALSAAETGHLVLASLHTVNAPQTIERIVDVFDPRQQSQVRVQLAATLRAIVCQTLFRNERGGGLIPACEIMVTTPAISRAIRENDIHLIHGMIETGAQWGMQTLDAAVAALVRDGYVSRDEALAKASDRERLERLLQRRAAPPESTGCPAPEPPAARSAPALAAADRRKPWE